jgi:hypothetical protein
MSARPAPAVVLFASAFLSACANDGTIPIAFLPDAAPVNCVADYAEQNDALNDPGAPGGGAELTRLVVPPGGTNSVSLCGDLNPAFARAQFLDVDFYFITVGGDAPMTLRAEVTVPTIGPTQSVRAELWNKTVQTLGGGNVLTGFTLVEAGPLTPGDYLVSVTMTGEPPPVPLPYKVVLREDRDPCLPPTAPIYFERDESPTYRLNDTVSIQFVPRMFAQLTVGVPEPTGIVLPSGVPAVIGGRSGAVLSAGDFYRDRDTFAFSAAADVNEIKVRLGWPHQTGANLDVFLFAAGDPTREFSGGGGSIVGTTDDELFVAPILPGLAYWLWVGEFDDPHVPPVTVDYVATLCGRHFTPTP